jgi:hypothetical protein
MARPQDHEKDHLAPTAARGVSPLGGVTMIRSFELPDTWYSVNDWFCGMVGWIDAPFVSVCTETRCKTSIELLGRTSIALAASLAAVAKPNCCVNLQVLGIHTDGGMRETVIPSRKLHPSERLTLDQLALVETLGRMSRYRPGGG